jgi:hypothetical protein
MMLLAFPFVRLSISISLFFFLNVFSAGSVFVRITFSTFYRLALLKKYPTLVSLEDPFDSVDVNGWKVATFIFVPSHANIIPANFSTWFLRKSATKVPLTFFTFGLHSNFLSLQKINSRSKKMKLALRVKVCKI